MNFQSADAFSRHEASTWVIDYMLIAEQAWYMHRDGFINGASDQGFENLCMTDLAAEGGREIWPVVKESWEQDVSRYFQKRLKEDGATTPKHYDVIPLF